MLFAGQDCIWGRGSINGFPQIYLGIAADNEDIDAGENHLAYVGTAGGPTEGPTGTLHAESGVPIGPCFQDNPFNCDDITGYGSGLFDYASGTAVGLAGCISADPVCTDNTAQFQRDLIALYPWLTGGVIAVDETAWGSGPRSNVGETGSASGVRRSSSCTAAPAEQCLGAILGAMLVALIYLLDCSRVLRSSSPIRCSSDCRS